MNPRIAALEQRLRTALTPERLEISDQSAAHAGHAGAREGGHFSVLIVSAAFSGQTLLQRHRLVHAAVAELFGRDIHALSIQARTPEEAAALCPTPN